MQSKVVFSNAMRKSKLKTHTVRLTPEVADALKKRSRKTGVSAQRIHEDALKAALQPEAAA